MYIERERSCQYYVLYESWNYSYLITKWSNWFIFVCSAGFLGWRREKILYFEEQTWSATSIYKVSTTSFSKTLAPTTIGGQVISIDTLSQFLLWQNIIWIQTCCYCLVRFFVSRKDKHTWYKLGKQTWEGGDEQTLHINVITHWFASLSRFSLFQFDGG